MTGIDELDHYELLEIPTTATMAEIERAYRLALQTYAEGSLALYSIFESADAAAIRDRLDEAYRVLGDPENRAGYDKLNQAPGRPSGSPVRPGGEGSEPSREGTSSENTMDAFDEIVQEYDALEEDEGSEFDGVRLRRTRLFRGFEIDDIADVTKVSRTHLCNIEEENFVDLPADVYVRGFVTAYAKTIGLDPTIVVPSYMARVQESRSGDQRGRFLGRR
jgi:curved DNA-binding protein CbpA